MRTRGSDGRLGKSSQIKKRQTAARPLALFSLSLPKLHNSPCFFSLSLFFSFSLLARKPRPPPGHQGDRQGRAEGRPPRQHGREAQGSHGRGEEERADQGRALHSGVKLREFEKFFFSLSFVSLPVFRITFCPRPFNSQYRVTLERLFEGRNGILRRFDKKEREREKKKTPSLLSSSSITSFSPCPSPLSSPPPTPPSRSRPPRPRERPPPRSSPPSPCLSARPR